MRKVYFYFGIALAACFISCADKDFVGDSGHTPAQTGDEVTFVTKVSNENSIVDADSRTVYGIRTQTGIPVNWEHGDRIMIHCDQASAPASKSVEYEIGIDKNSGIDYDQDGIPEGNAADEVMKVNTTQAGLQWGDPNQIHQFLAIYPAENVIPTGDQKVRAEIPVLQNPEKWITTTDDQTGKKTYYGEPNMKNAFMYAHNNFDPKSGDEVELKFKNLVTVLDITVQGPTTGDPIELSSINVEAYGDNADDIAITGKFDIDVAESEAGSTDVTATCTPVEDGTTSNRIAISCYDPNMNEGKGGYITLGPGDNLNVKAYLLPNSDKSETITPGRLQIVVNPNNNEAPRIKHLVTANIVPHKVNRVRLPFYESSNKTNYWMSRLNPNVYASQLSLPGSKLSVARDDINGLENLHFQGSDIATQFLDGVRAFNIAVRCHNTAGPFQQNYVMQSVVESKDNSQKYYVEDLSTSLNAIHQQLQKAIDDGAKNEFAFVQLVWCSDGWGTDGNIWLEQLSNFIRDNADTYGIYTRTFNDQTTIGELEGKIVVMLNVNTTGMNVNDIPGDSPSLYARWSGAEPARYSNPSAALPVLCWKEWNDNSPMKWYASEATAVGVECTWEEKQDFVKHMLEFTLSNYDPGVWVMNDMGGFTNRNDKGSTLSGMNRVTYLTTTLNNSAVETLQARSANASLGIIYMNFADMQEGSGKEYQSDWLIQTIIDNNFKFPMQMRPTNGDTRTQYNAAYSKGGNAIGWDN